MNYKKIYNQDYFLGKTSFFYRLGYKDAPVHNSIKLSKILDFKKRGRLLDAGCAMGYFLKSASKRFKVYGFDVSAYAIGKAREVVPEAELKVHQAERKLPYPKAFFDVITAFDILEHLENPEALIRNLNMCLKRNGILAITTCNKNIIRRLLFFLPDMMEHHVSLMSLDELTCMLERNGFEIVYSKGALSTSSQMYLSDSKLYADVYVIAKKTLNSRNNN